jgi:glucuronokinase
LLGNPSDGYEGKVIACPVRNFVTEVSLRPAERVTISASGTSLVFDSLDAALRGPWPEEADGLEMLVLASARRLARGFDPVPTSGLSLECSTTIPRQVGLSGSSAAIIATIRVLAKHWHLALEPFDLAEMALATETEDLGIAAGPMDRVIQAYERTMVLDLAPPRTRGSYTLLKAELPSLLIAWTPSTGRSSDVTHSDLRSRWLSGDAHVTAVMGQLADLVPRGAEALVAGDHGAYADLVDRNFDLRCSVTDVGEVDLRMVRLARGANAAAKLCGSGGAVLVVPRTGTDLERLERSYAEAGFRTCRPRAA